MENINSNISVISEFSGDFAFLSNFFIKPTCFPLSYKDDFGNVKIYTVECLSLEHAYQAAKTLDIEEQKTILLAKTPGIAKRLGRKISLQENWDSKKISKMKELLEIKFKNPEMKEKLLSTKDARLIEGNNWNDKFWGKVNGIGENWLGRLLMEVRSNL